MTTLDRLPGTEDFSADEERIARAIFRIDADEKVALPAFEAARRALSSLPAQAVGVTVPQRWRDVGYLMACIDDAIEQGYDPDVDGPLLDEIRAELKALPSQPAAVGDKPIAWRGWWAGAGSIDSVTRTTHIERIAKEWAADGAEVTPLAALRSTP